MISTAYNLTIGVDHTYYVDVAHAAVLVHNRNQENITDTGLNHSFKHAPQWFGRAVSRNRDFGAWRSLIERAAQSTKVFAWDAGGEPTWAQLARVLGAMLRLLGK